MDLIKIIKKNNGSSLTLVLFMLFLLAVTAIAVITVTSSELGMSVMTSDRSKALMLAQAGAEKAAQILDEKVAQAQEEARVLSSQVIQKELDACVTLGNIRAGSPLKEIIDITDTGAIRILKEEELEKIYYNEYKYQFNKKINGFLAELQNPLLELDEAPFKPGNVHLIDLERHDDKFVYSEVSTKREGPVLTSIDSIETEQTITSIGIKSSGEYKSANGSTYRRAIVAEFGLLTDKKVDGSTEIPVSYGKLTKVRVNKPSMIKDKAMVAAQNIISVNGRVRIAGNVVAFGTIPLLSTSNDKYFAEENGHKYGGLMAGITLGIWNDPAFGDGTNTLKDNLQEAGDAELFEFRNYSGSLEINGDAATLAYIHSLYRSEADNIPEINITGNAYARCVKAEKDAHFSLLKFKNLYVTDDVRIDASNSKMEIGEWLGEEPVKNLANPTDTSHEGNLVGLNTGAFSLYSSSVAILGDSSLNINGGVYMGGSTYYREYTLVDDPNKEMYSSGMSIQKSGSLPAQAFEVYREDTIPVTEDYPRDIFYLYENIGPGSTGRYIEVKDPQLLTSQYIMTGDPKPKQMMSGIIGKTEPFNILDKAMHFKEIWKRFWKDNLGYFSYLNSGDIKITSTDTNGKLKGWCYGAVAANGEVYGPYNGFNNSAAEYRIKQEEGNEGYTELMNSFIDSKDSLTDTSPQKKLTGNADIAHNSVNPEALPANELIQVNSDTFIYNSEQNVVLSNDNVGHGRLTKDSDGYIMGIVYSDKDIYVKSGTKFKGMLIAQGNIVFLGDADIKYDEAVVDTLLSEDPRVQKFFNSAEILMNNENAIIQTIKKTNVKNIKIITWKEV